MERIVLSSLNGTEMLRTLASHGVNTIGLRFMNPAEFARTALMRSGNAISQDFLIRKDEAALMDVFLRKTDYFKSASFSDAESMASALFSLRSLICEEEGKVIHEKFVKGEFEDKNKAMTEVYDTYISELEKRNMIDTIGVMRKALSEAKQLECEVLTLAELALSPLEKELVKKLANKSKECSLSNLFGTSEKACVKGITYLRSYGFANEVEKILSDISKAGIPYDRCTVAVAETSRYAQLFYEYSKTQGIDVSFGCGIPITNTNPARLLRALVIWETTGYHGYDALNSLIFNEAVDRTKLMSDIGIDGNSQDLRCIVEMLGNLKADCNESATIKKLDALKPVLEAWVSEHNIGTEDRDYKAKADKLRLMEPAKKLAIELGKGYSFFIKQYSKIRIEPDGRIDRAAVNVICDAIDSYVAFSEKKDIGELIPEILNKTVCSEPSREGALHVTGINGAFSALRSHLFIAGLSAANYPGNPSENYLLLDSDYEMFGPDLPTSVNKIQAKKQSLKDLIKLACSLGIPVRLSYSNYNAAEMSAANASSVLFEIYKEEHKDADTRSFEDAFDTTGYFDCSISAADAIGKAYTEGKSLEYVDVVPEHEDFSVQLKEKGYAPTALEKFFQCPKSFLLSNVIGIYDDDTVDPFNVIDAKQFGTLAHSVMERLAQMPSRPTKEEFLQKASKAFDDFLKEYVPVNEERAVRERKTFLDVMEKAFDKDPANEVLSAEKKVTVEHESGVNVYGYPDRVEKDASGKYLIADFKTGNSIKHVKDDIDTCLQVVIYAYMLEKLGIAVSYGDYRYLRYGESVTCEYNLEIKDKLNAKLKELKDAMETGRFPTNTGGANNPNCAFCKFGDICGRERKEA